MKRFLVTISIIAALFAFAGCRHANGGGKPRVTVDKELLNLSKEQIFQKGEDAFNAKKYARARKFYSNVYENYPNDPLGRRSLLRVADSYFKQGDAVNLVEAQYKYRDFINRYPGSEFADYAMLQIANVSGKQMERPDRDQTKTKEAVQKYQEMIASYPNSKYLPEAQEKLQAALDHLAKHEEVVARFYIKRHQYAAAVTRLNGIVDTYPNYNARDQVFYLLGEALRKLGRNGEARLYYERVVAEFPKSEMAKRAKQQLDNLKS